MSKQIELTQEELELIGQTRYRKEHGKNMIKIFISSFVVAIALSVLLLNTAPGFLYVLGLLPAVIPYWFSNRLENQAKKAGVAFAGELITKTGD